MAFRIEQEHLGAVKVIMPDVYSDHRGFFMESYRQDAFAALGISDQFLQDNHSRSVRGVVRGLHFQWEAPMSKLMRVTNGRAFLVAADIRRGSPTLGQWVGVEVSAENKRLLWAPAGFATGFSVLSEVVEVQYKCTAIYNPQAEGGVRWDDPAIGVDWQVEQPILSAKDQQTPLLQDWLQTAPAAVFAYRE